MDGAEEVISALHLRYGDEVCPVGGPICRAELAKRVFGSDEERLWLNSLVHRMVREDVERWYALQIMNGAKRCFVESAILVSSGLAQMCKEVWIVTASDDVRIARIKQRDSLDEEAIRKRMQSQLEEESLLKASDIPTRIIDNSGNIPILDQIAKK